MTTDQPTPAQARPDLKPCPFCRASLKHEGSFYLHPEIDCVMQHSVFHQDSETAKLWNNRVESSQQETLAKVRELLARLDDEPSVELNTSNHCHDDVCSLNNGYVEYALGIREALALLIEMGA